MTCLMGFAAQSGSAVTVKFNVRARLEVHSRASACSDLCFTAVHLESCQVHCSARLCLSLSVHSVRFWSQVISTSSPSASALFLLHAFVKSFLCSSVQVWSIVALRFKFLKKGLLSSTW